MAKSSGSSDEEVEKGKNKGGLISNVLRGDSSANSSSADNPSDKKKSVRAKKKKNKESSD